MLVCRIAVPFFFFTSGYFLSAHFSEEGWFARECKKRIKTLVVPYVLFCIIYALWLMFLLKENPFNSLHSVLSIFGINCCFPAASPLWYVRALSILVLLSPVVYIILLKIGWPFLLLVAIAYVYFSFGCLSSELVRTHLRFSFSLLGLMYFSLGCWLRMRRVDLMALSVALKPWRWLFAVLSIVIAVVCFYVNRTMGLRVACETFTIPFVLLFLWGCNFSFSWAVGYSFPIYCLHSLFLMFFRLKIWHSTECPSVVAGVFVWLGVLVASMTLTCICKRCVPGVSSILFGNRINR